MGSTEPDNTLYLNLINGKKSWTERDKGMDKKRGQLVREDWRTHEI